MQPCQELASIPAGTRIACLYDVNALHSEQLGLGPFTNSAFTVLVKNGQIVEVRNSSNHENNGLADHFKSIAGWIRENHPGDHAFMFKADHTKAETQRFYRLWEQHSQEYADAMTQEKGSGSAP